MGDRPEKESQSIMCTLEARARWYVYELVDGRTGAVFYVGKGCGKRMLAHEKEADKGVRSRKVARILEIRAAGSVVERRQVAFFWDEQAAYDFETEHIDWYGLGALTNVLPGGQKAWAKRRDELRSRKKAQPLDVVDTVVKLAAQFAFWLLHTNGGKIAVRPVFRTGSEAQDKLRNDIAALAWGKLLPQLWEKATSSTVGRSRVAEALKPFGIEVVEVGAA